jgi:hypothetical protein
MPQAPYPAAYPYATTAAPQPVPQAQVLLSAPPVAVDSGSRGLRIGGIVCGAAGLVLIGTGVIFYAQATSLSDSVAKAKTFNPSDYDSGKQAETLQWVAYGLGGAALGTGLVLYLLGRPSSGAGNQARLSLAPVLLPDGGGIATGGTF